MSYLKSRVPALLAVAAVLSSMVFPLAVDLRAQSEAMRVRIPFEFQVVETRLPAGTYLVEKRGEAIRLSDADGHSVAVVAIPTANRAPQSDNLLIFNRYGQQYFLSEVLWMGYSTASGIIKSRTEIELAKLSAAKRVLTAEAAKD
jgi:hypothetical protein